MKTFRETAGCAGLKKPAIDKLVSQDFDAIEVVKLMSAEDIAELEVSKGQTRVLERWVTTLNAPDPTATRAAVQPELANAPDHHDILSADVDGEIPGPSRTAPQNPVGRSLSTNLYPGCPMTITKGPYVPKGPPS